jgi:hypothetical protein
MLWAREPQLLGLTFFLPNHSVCGCQCGQCPRTTAGQELMVTVPWDPWNSLIQVVSIGWFCLYGTLGHVGDMCGYQDWGDPGMQWVGCCSSPYSPQDAPPEWPGHKWLMPGGAPALGRLLGGNIKDCSGAGVQLSVTTTLPGTRPWVSYPETKNNSKIIKWMLWQLSVLRWKFQPLFFLGTKDGSRASCILDKCSATELHPSPTMSIFYPCELSPCHCKT